MIFSTPKKMKNQDYGMADNKVSTKSSTPSRFGQLFFKRKKNVLLFNTSPPPLTSKEKFPKRYPLWGEREDQINKPTTKSTTAPKKALQTYSARFSLIVASP